MRYKILCRRSFCADDTDFLVCEEEGNFPQEAIDHACGKYLQYEYFTVTGYYRSPVEFHSLKWLVTFRIDDNLDQVEVERRYVRVPRPEKKPKLEDLK